MLAPGLSEKIFAAKDGERLAPFQTSQGWHIIEVQSRRNSPVASFEDRYEQIRDLVLAQKLGQFLSELKQDAKIDYISEATIKPPATIEPAE